MDTDSWPSPGELAKEISLKPQDIVADYQEQWKKIWLRFDGLVGAP